ncbi:MAG: biotin--[acetyl-CoA-carboxylase] ligase [Burkholderiaceae bacterium]|nr:MAG: biotin--[acetyl-CoA-carboxylase] ligase [Burkholderiaceae bacterium]MBE7425770.1 biotin--[acetyl-CoA-carboxylase] ligase [Ideonella sp.]MCC7285086.1 biotin--[acetyl-CoA-carboxylase] ligase [Burkholderiaceae bacterium]
MQEPVVQSWNTEPLWRELSTLLPGLAIEVVARCESTSTELVERARRSGGVADAVPSRPGELEPPVSGPMPLLEATRHGRRVGDTQPCLLVAEQQTRGRGRWGRSWQSSAGASLTCSLALPFAPPDWSGLSLAIGVALADALDPACALDGAHIGLKWPNDLMRIEPDASPRKMGGILIESVPVGQRRMAVIGVGLNVAAQAVADARHGVAWLQEFAPGIDPPRTLARIARPWIEAVLQFEREGFAPFRPRYERRDCLRGRVVTTTLDSVPQGVAEGIDAGGALQVRVGAALHTVGSGDVSVSSDGPAP